MEYRLLMIDVGTGEWKVERYRIGEVVGPIDLGVRLHLERFKSWERGVFDPSNAVVMGMGLFAGGKLIGSHRIVAVFRSPQTLGIHVSAMGGAAYQFMGTGVDCIAVVGRSSKPTVIAVVGDEEGLREVRTISLGEDELWRVYRGYRDYEGVRALTVYVFDVLGSLDLPRRVRAAVVGPAAFRTRVAGIFSPLYDPQRARFQPGAFDSASRGGGGSVLARAHNVVAIVFGGDYTPLKRNPKLADLKLIDGIVREALGSRYVEAIMSTTKKYRFDPKLGTGGTFGVNYIHYRDLVPFFGYNSIYMSRTTRMRVLEEILERFWKPFQQEVFESREKPWQNCGEPCPVVCKKVWRGLKVDYEPFNALGPLSGILRLEDAARLVELVDSLGLDAIEAGHTVAWLMELVHRGLLEPEEVGIDAKPCFDPILYDAERCSRLNAEIAEELIRGLVEGRTPILKTVAEEGLRGAARRLDEMHRDRISLYGVRFEDLLVYAAYGDRGYMTPNLYWAPGMVAPMYILGRYWTNYSPTFMEPEDLARSSLSRALYELLIDNGGFCRFHRGWAEKVIEKLYQEIWGIRVNTEFAARVYMMIAEYQRRAGAEPKPWESRKTIDMVASMAAEVGAEEWATKFTKNPWNAAKEWWERFRKTVEEELARRAGTGSHPPTGTGGR